MLLFRRGIIKPTEGYKNLNHYGMFESYFKIALRNIIKNRGYSFINISGLAIGMAATMLILMWVQNEISVDRFHENTDRIFQMYSRDQNNGQLDVWGNTPALLAPELKQSYGEVEDAVRFRIVYFLTKTGEKHYNVAGAFADPNFLSVFSFPLLHGTKSALQDDSGVVLAEKLAIKLFGTTDCIGKTVIINDNDSFMVAGVLKGSPSLDFDEKVKNITIKHIEKGDGSTREVFSHPLSKIHLYASPENGRLTRGRIETVQLFITIAAFILLIACINFMNL